MRTMCFAVISAKIQEPVISGVDKFAPVGVEAGHYMGAEYKGEAMQNSTHKAYFNISLTPL